MAGYKKGKKPYNNSTLVITSNARKGDISNVVLFFCKSDDISYEFRPKTIIFDGKTFKWDEVREQYICMEKVDADKFVMVHGLAMPYDRPIECWNAYELYDYSIGGYER